MAMKSAVLALGMALGAAAASAAGAQEPVLTRSEVTLVGCIEEEAAYRTKIGERPVGVGKTEIVLSGTKPGGTTRLNVYGTFNVTGPLEKQLVTEVGHAVQITGVIEDEATHDRSMERKKLRPLFVKMWQPAAATCG